MRDIAERDGFDPESAHVKADQLMCQTLTALGYEEGALIFAESLTKWSS